MSSPTLETSEGAELARQITPILDPSTNTNPLLDQNERNNPNDKKKKKRRADVSKHTFYIENSQMRLKLFARNEVNLLPVRLQSALSTESYTAPDASVDSRAGEGITGVALYWQEQIRQLRTYTTQRRCAVASRRSKSNSTSF